MFYYVDALVEGCIDLLMFPYFLMNFTALGQKRLVGSVNLFFFYVYACNSGAVAFRGAQFNRGTGPIFLDQLFCSGSETSVLECMQHIPLGLSTCKHSQDAGVRCIGM